MEDPQSLSVESFSNTWLANRTVQNPRFDSFRLSFDAADSASFIEMDPNLTPSKRFLVSPDFDFLPKSSQTRTTSFVDGDKLISNGTLVLLKSKDGPQGPELSSGPYGPSFSDDIPVTPLSSTTRAKGRLGKSRSMSLGKCNKLPKIIIQKYMDLVRPLWCRMRRGRSDSSRVQGVEQWEYSGSADNRRRRSCDSESSIHEAVVHCKKTIGMR